MIDGKEVRTDGEGNFKLETKVGNIAVKKISSKVEGSEDYSSEVIAKNGETIKIPLNPKYGETVVVNGLTVKLRKGIPAKALSFVAEDYVNMVRKEAPKLIQNVDGEEQITIDKEVVYEAIETVTASYPKPDEIASEDDEVAIKALETVVEDFPDFGDKLEGETDETKILEAYETVSQVYYAQQTYAVNRQMINNEEKTVNKLKNNVYDEVQSKLKEWQALTFNEKTVILENILYIKEIENARNKSFEISGNWNDQDYSDTQKDALRHTLWQYLTCEYVTTATKRTTFSNYNKMFGESLAERLGTARETAYLIQAIDFAETSPIMEKRYSYFDQSNVMDIHNNAYARNYFDRVTSTEDQKIRINFKSFKIFRRRFVIPVPVHVSSKFNRPSETQVINYLKNEITQNGIYIDISNSALLENFLNLGVKREGVQEYIGDIIYLKQYI